jgi:hypothetical protein
MESRYTRGSHIQMIELQITAQYKLQAFISLEHYGNSFPVAEF